MSLHHVRAATILAVFFSFSGSALAQSGERPHAIEKGSWALLFQVEDVFRLDYLDGMLALKYHLAEQHAVRLGVGANARTANDGQQVYGGVSGQVQYFLYPRPRREVKFYIGAGPRIGYGTQRVEAEGSSRMRDDSWTFGLAGGLGAEWFPTRHISIFGEFGNHAGMSIREHESNSPAATSHDYFYETSARLGIAAYL